MSKLTVSAFLKKAKSLIDTPNKWIQGQYAQDAHGLPVLSTHSTATCFCSVGALRRAELEFGNFHLRMGSIRSLRKALDNDSSSIVKFNDSHTHKEVMQVWDRAIAIAEAEEVAK